MCEHPLSNPREPDAPGLHAADSRCADPLCVLPRGHEGLHYTNTHRLADNRQAAISRERLPDDAPNRWVEPSCRYCKPGEPCLTHDRRPRTLAQNRIIFGPSFGYEPTDEDHEEAAFPWTK